MLNSRLLLANQVQLDCAQACDGYTCAVQLVSVFPQLLVLHLPQPLHLCHIVVMKLLHLQQSMEDRADQHKAYMTKDCVRAPARICGDLQA